MTRSFPHTAVLPRGARAVVRRPGVVLVFTALALVCAVPVARADGLLRAATGGALTNPSAAHVEVERVLGRARVRRVSRVDGELIAPQQILDAIEAR